MASWRLLLIFSFSLISVNCIVSSDNVSNNYENHASDISAVLANLNSTPFKVYHYKSATLLSAHTKADITELTLDVSVNCVNRYPDVPCSEKSLICNAFVRNSPEEGSQVLNEVKCKPKPEIIVEEAPMTSDPTDVGVNESKPIALSNEAVSSEVGEHFVAVRRNSVPCLGCPFDLNPNAEGVDELVAIALSHIESERPNRQALLEILKLQQQVVGGVKYFLVIKIAPTVCPKDLTAPQVACPLNTQANSTICQIIYLHKPWISKTKHVIANNCTTLQEFVLLDAKMNNEVDANDGRTNPSTSPTNFDQIAETGAIDEMTLARLSDLESQIMVEQTPQKATDDVVVPSCETSVQFLETPSSPTEVDSTETPLASEQDMILNDFVATFYAPKNYSEDVQSKAPIQEDDSSETSAEEGAREKRSEESIESDETNSTLSDLRQASNSSEESTEEVTGRPKRAIYLSRLERAANSSEESLESAESHESNSTLSGLRKPDNSSEESSEEMTSRPRRAIPQLEKISPDERHLVKNLADFAAKALDDIDDDNLKRIILQILGAKKMVGNDGVYYHLIMRMGVSRCLEDKAHEENCREKLFENYTKICKVQIYVKDDFANPKMVKSQCQNIKRDNDKNRTNYGRFKRKFKRQTLLGGQSQISKDDELVVQYLEGGLKHLDAQSSHDNKLKVQEVLSATSQVVAGHIYRIKAKIVLSDCKKSAATERGQCGTLQEARPKVCDFIVFEQGWVPNSRVTNVTCEENEVYSFREKRSLIADQLTSKLQKNNKKFKRQMTGAPGSLSKNSSEVIKYMEIGLRHLDLQSNHKNKLKVEKIISATRQIVAGDIYRIKAKIVLSDCKKSAATERGQCGTLQGARPKVCDFVVFEKSWVPNSRVTNVNCEKNETYSFKEKPSLIADQLTSELRKSNEEFEGLITGAQASLSKNSSEVVKYMEIGLRYLDLQSNHKNKLKVEEILSATRQIVAGDIYRIKAKIVLSDCKKSAATERGQCGTLQEAQPKVCDFVVFEKSWVPNSRVTNVNCEKNETYSFKEKPSLIADQLTSELRKNNEEFEDEEDEIDGEAIPLSKNSSKVVRYMEIGLRHLDSQSNHKNKLKVEEILSATEVEVAGRIYYFKAKIVLSDCKKTVCTKRDQCGTLKGSEPKICEFEFYEGWVVKKPSEATITCEGNESYSFRPKRSLVGDDSEQQRDNDKNRTNYDRLKRKFKRQIPGGQSQISKDHELVVQYLEGGLKHLDAQSSHDNKLKVQEVLSATSQVVAGHIYRIKAKIVLSDCKKSAATERGQCGTLQEARPKVCDFVVFEQSWVPNSRVTNVTCEENELYSFREKRSLIADQLTSELQKNNKKFKRQIPGGQSQISNDHELVVQYLEGGLKHLDAQSSHDNKLKVQEVLSATSQVVAGHIYRIKAKIVLSDCKKSAATERGQCGTLQEARPKVCDFVVFEQNWVPNSRVTNVTCEENEVYSFREKRSLIADNESYYSRAKRSLVGDDSEQLTSDLFNDFMRTYNKKYEGREYTHRLKVFSDNLKYIRMLNAYEQGTAFYGVTKFTDMTRKEFSRSRGLRMDLRNENEMPFTQAQIPNVELPVEFDWRKKGAVTEVKNQGQCGSCWAFSVTGNVEGQYALRHSSLMELSEQELVDCDTEDQGCNGGLMDTAYRVIEKLGGLETEQDYPYEAEDEKCHFNKTLARVQLSGALNISHNETDMAKWLVANGPISIAINANAMQFYMGGVSHPFKFLCNPKSLDHGVLIVGYGVHTYPLFKKTLPYWIVKNSWGKDWGEQGYYRVYRGDGTCGLNQTPSSAIVA